jgi:multicomponent Na+:H+ antiporter subunit C
VSLGLFVSQYNYWVVIFLMMVGFYILISRGNLIKKIVGLNVFQTAVFMLYISMGKVSGGTPPILVGDPHGTDEGHNGAEGGLDGAVEGLGGAEALGGSVAEVVYSNPLPHVLILTAIVVGIATTSVGLALAVRIKEAYGTIEEDEIARIEAGTEAEA